MLESTVNMINDIRIIRILKPNKAGLILRAVFPGGSFVGGGGGGGGGGGAVFPGGSIKPPPPLPRHISRSTNLYQYNFMQLLKNLFKICCK